MDNYAIAKERARQYFLTRDRRFLAARTGVRRENGALCFPFLGSQAQLSEEDGTIRLAMAGKEPWEADFGEALSIYDWICDAKPNAAASGEYTAVHSLPGVFVGGSGGLMLGTGDLPQRIEAAPERFSAACEALGGRPFPIGDLGCMLDIFPGVSAVLKFYFSDEDFPPQLTVLWDRNMLDFVKYETVYYIAGVLFRRIKQEMA